MWPGDSPEPVFHYDHLNSKPISRKNHCKLTMQSSPPDACKTVCVQLHYCIVWYFFKRSIFVLITADITESQNCVINQSNKREMDLLEFVYYEKRLDALHPDSV